MIIVNGSRAKYLFSFSILILLLISGCKTTDVASVRQDQLPLLPQDSHSLKNSNGKIVESRSVNVKSEWSDKIECYKIKYLSDGLKVVGFVVKPKTGRSRFPAIIFNRAATVNTVK
jgi:hypothetical protein